MIDALKILGAILWAPVWVPLLIISEFKKPTTQMPVRTTWRLPREDLERRRYSQNDPFN